MLAYLAVVLCLSGGVRGQNFVYSANNEYGQIAIHQYKIIDGDQFSGNDPAIQMDLHTLAANGYGQWTCTADMGNKVEISGHPWLFSPDQKDVNSAGTWEPTTGTGVVSPNNKSAWLLLSNLISKPSEKYVSGSTSSHPGCQPPGVVSGGKLYGTYPDAPKVVANLTGSVRYIWPTGDRTGFVVQGLNTVSGSTDASRQIDITLDGLPNPTSSRQIVKYPIYHYLPSGSEVSTNGNSVTTEAGAGTFHEDEFDPAIDNAYTYLVWESGGNIFAKVLNLDGTTAQAAFNVGTGTHPTVACDVRQNASGTPVWHFYVAFILSSGKVKVEEYGASTGTTSPANSETLTNTFHDPILSGSGNDHTFPLATTPITHARVVVSSVAGSSTITVAVYAREADDFLFYNVNLSSWTGDIVWYVDGTKAYQGAGTYPLPSPIPQNTGGHRNGVAGIVDGPIRAFANPYDNQSGTYNQFHCLYQIKLSNNGSVIKNPLILIRGADNNFGYNPNSNTHDTRVLLNQETGSVILSDPTSYSGAINQMGIHIHWKEGSNHYYVRDVRAFDEDIEENTLATNLCIVKDGTEHGGSANPTVLDGLKFTLWTDPNYGASSTDYYSGAYRSDVIGSSSTTGFNYITETTFNSNWGVLRFMTDGNYLGIGTSTGSTLYTVPISVIQQYPSGTSMNEVRIAGNSVWKYFSSEPEYDPTATGMFPPFHGLINVNLLGTSSTAVAELDVQPGAIFEACGKFTSDFGKVDIGHGNDVSILPSASNFTADGIFVIDHNNANLANSDIISHVATGAVPVMYILGTGSGVNVTDVTYVSHTTTYTNSGAGVGIVQYNLTSNGGYSPDYVMLSGDNIDLNSPTLASFTNMRFHGLDPQMGGLEFINFNVDQFSGNVIHIERTGNLTNGYRGIYVNGNNFLSSTGAQLQNDYNGILLENFNDHDHLYYLGINGNHFIHASTTGDDSYAAAIQLINSSGVIEVNKVSDIVFDVGVQIINTDDLRSYSFLCSDTLYTDIGINSRDYQGYVKLCQLGSGDIGYYSSDNDVVKIVNTTISNCGESGIYISPAVGFTPAEVDLTGVHGATSGSVDIAAKNTISNNGLYTTAGPYAQVMLANNFCLVDFGKLQSWWTHWSENNTIGSTTSPKLVDIFQPSQNIGDIDNNYWGGVDPHPSLTIHSAQFGTFNGSAWSITYSSSSAPLSQSVDSTTICQGIITGCGDLDTLHKAHQNHYTLSTIENSPYDTCTRLKDWVHVSPQPGDSIIAKKQYDSLKIYVEHCANIDPEICFVFNHLDGAAEIAAPHNPNLSTEYRQWLASVLLMNTKDPCYYCVCMGSIASTFPIGSKYYPSGSFAVKNYLRSHHPECWGAGNDAKYSSDSAYWAQKGYDVQNLPSLDSIDLGFLETSAVSPSPIAISGNTLLSLISPSPNPFTKETTLDFTLNRMTYVTVGVYDELGRWVWGDSHGYSLEAGKHTVHIEGKDLPHGALYARISTGFGEVKTVKIIHE
ncbi:MAG: hypothetical protein WCH46_09865 [bacterium]